MNYDLGRIPPQAIDIEEAILGAVLLESDAYDKICDILVPESFYKEEHSTIFRACTQLSITNKRIDLLTVSDQLRVDKSLEECGGPVYIAQLTSKVASSSHIEQHARIIHQKFIQRELIRISSEIINVAYDDMIDVQDLLDFAENNLFKIQEGMIQREAVKISTVGESELKRLEEVSKSDKEFTGLPSGFTSIDRLTSGWQNTDLIILAARPAMGKTAFALEMAKNITLHFNKSVGFFSLEMGVEQLWQRVIAGLSNIDSGKIRSAKFNEFDWRNLENAQRSLESCNLFVDDTPGLSLLELRAKARRLKTKHGIEIIFIDYLQLMSGLKEQRGNREQEISTISRGLKILAKELKIPIICLSQLNRSVEQRGDKIPMLSDLRESGAIEQDADIVAFIHRPEEYGVDQYEDGETTKNAVEIHFKKHRNGATSEVRLRKNDNYSKMANWDDSIDDIKEDQELFNNDDIDIDKAFN